MTESSKNVQHHRNVLSAAYSYINLQSMNITKLATSFRVCESVISNWLCEAVEKRYIESDSMCKAIMDKHIKEYESKYNMPDSCLRRLYAEAFEKRQQLTAVSDEIMSAITA